MWAWGLVPLPTQVLPRQLASAVLGIPPWMLGTVRPQPAFDAPVGWRSSPRDELVPTLSVCLQPPGFSALQRRQVRQGGTEMGLSREPVSYKEEW